MLTTLVQIFTEEFWTVCRRPVENIGQTDKTWTKRGRTNQIFIWENSISAIKFLLFTLSTGRKILVLHIYTITSHATRESSSWNSRTETLLYKSTLGDFLELNLGWVLKQPLDFISSIKDQVQSIEYLKLKQKNLSKMKSFQKIKILETPWSI